jgi:secretion/DNA translocation related CpaE-like protein
MAERPLILTDDEDVLDDLLRVAAAAGVDVTHQPDPESRALWRTAPVILIDAALVPRAVELALSRRPGVVVVAAREPESELWELCVRLGAERTIVLPTAQEQLITVLSDASSVGTGGGVCVAVIGACGGAGSSVFAAALAMAAAERVEALLVDCDPWGAGLDFLLGVEATPGLRWAELAVASGRLPAAELQLALPRVRCGAGRLAILCHGRDRTEEISAAAVDVVLDSGRRGGFTTVVDLPRQPGAAADRVLEQADLVVLVAPADVRGGSAAERVCGRLRQFGARAGVVVRGPSPGGLGAAELADVLQLPLLARMRADPSLPLDLEFGLGLATDRRRPLARAAREVLRSLRAGA